MLQYWSKSMAGGLLCLAAVSLSATAQATSMPVEGLNGAISVVMSKDTGGAKRHLYVAGRDDNAISVFEVKADGSLAFVRAYYDGKDGVDGLSYVSEIALSPDNQYLYAVGRLANAISVFHRDAATGALTFVQILKNGMDGVDGLHEASGVAISPDGKNVYATAGHDSKVSIFSRDAASGRLTYTSVLENGQNGVQGIGGSFPVTVSPDGKSVYVGGGTESTIAVFARDAATGALHFSQVMEAGTNNEHGLVGISGLTVSPDGLNVYAASWGTDLGLDSTVAVFSRNPDTGELGFVETHANKTQAGGDVPGMWGALAVKVSPDGGNVYVSALYGNEIAVFDRAAGTGALSNPKAVKQGKDGVDGMTYARDMVVEPEGGNVYAVSRVDNAVVWFKRNGGALAFGDQYRKPIGSAEGAQKLLANTDDAFSAKVKGSAPFTWRWETSDGRSVGPVTGAEGATATFNWPNAGQYTVKVTAENRDGVFTQTIPVEVKTSFGAADKAPVLKTGQTECYDANGAVVACGGTGQNADQPTGVSGPTPRFVQANGVVTDTWTGLEWLQDANCISSQYPQYDQNMKVGDGKVTWQQGLTFVKGINQGTYANCASGHTDWRLPNVHELQSLIDFGAGEPAMAGKAYFNNLASDFYWSSTSDENDPGSFASFYITGAGSTWRAWSVSMKTGESTADDKGGAPVIFTGFRGYVLPVRGQTKGVAAVAETGQKSCYDVDGNFISCAGTGQDGEMQAGLKIPSPRFQTADGVVTDALTGLSWLQNADCLRTEYPEYDQQGTVGDGTVTWQQALDFVKGVNNKTYDKCNAGKYTWRLPNIREIQTLVDFSLGAPAIANTGGQDKWTAGNPFNNVANVLYWSSTSDGHAPANTASRAWATGMRSGAYWADAKDGSGSQYGFPMGRVWPVLDAGSTTSNSSDSDTATSSGGGGGSFDIVAMLLLPLAGLLGGRLRKSLGAAHPLTGE